MYCTLVRLLLEYGCIIWSLFHNCHKISIERVQHRFLRYASIFLGQPLSVINHDYVNFQGELVLLSLENSTSIFGVLFLHGVLNSTIDSPNLLALFKVSNPEKYFRCRPLFYISRQRTLAGKFSPISRNRWLWMFLRHIFICLTCRKRNCVLGCHMFCADFSFMYFCILYIFLLFLRLFCNKRVYRSIIIISKDSNLSQILVKKREAISHFVFVEMILYSKSFTKL